MVSNTERLIEPVNFPKFIEHRIAKEHTPKDISAVMYQYLMAGNGIFVRAKRKEFSITLQISKVRINGLPFMKSLVYWSTPRINGSLWKDILENARCGCDEKAFREDFYVIYWNEQKSSWNWRAASRDRSSASTIADDKLEEYAKCCIELHTHPRDVIHFSQADDKDETGKFRIFAILVDIHGTPKIRFRCGVYDHFVQIPAEYIGDLPSEIIDLNGVDKIIGNLLK